MKHAARLALLCLGLLQPSACSSVGARRSVAPEARARPDGAAGDSKLRAALEGSARTPQERARDPQRHPRETLEFFGLRDDMRVVELWAPSGYYSAILAPVLREHGHLAVTMFDPNGRPDPARIQEVRQTRDARPFLERLEKEPDVYGRVERVMMSSSSFAFGPEASADLVLTFRNVHNWLADGYADRVFDAAFRVLKPGGVLGVVDHRGAPGMTPEQVGESGYIPEETIRARATKAGFRLEGRSEINANPRDTKDYAEGVWRLPPAFANGDIDRAKYAAIGESDRMTLKFVKPGGS